jgi:hypothetical protein
MAVDHFPYSLGRVEIDTPLGTETVVLSGPTTVEVDLGSLADGILITEIVQMELTGHSSLLGPVILRLRDPAKDPFHQSLGEMEENVHLHEGTFELPGTDPPFCVEPIPPDCEGTTADSFFDVYFEVEVGGIVLHNQTPKHMEATISKQPPAGGETYENPEWIQLYNEANTAVPIWVGPALHTPDPFVVGGIAELPDGAGASASDAGAPAEGSGWSAGSYAALAGGLAAAVLTLSAGACYARRRWVR